MKNFTESTHQWSFPEQFKASDKSQLKYKALPSLRSYAEKLSEKLDSDIAWKLFHLTRGNLCNRLSQYCYDQQDFEKAEVWGRSCY